MTAKNPQKAPKKPKGRPSDYNEQYYPKIAALLSQLGKTDKEIAKEFGVSEVTLNAWKQKHPNFLKSLKTGKEKIDQLVENALLRRALGYQFTETKRYFRPLFDSTGNPVIGKDGKQVKGIIREECTEKEVVADTTAQIFWLCNRKKETWRRNAVLEVDFDKAKGEISEMFDEMKKEVHAAPST